MYFELLNIFTKSVEAVKPSHLIKNVVSKSRNSDTLKIQNLSLNTSKNCYLVGFGKAVYEMAVEIESIVGEHLREGVISVPVGTQNRSKHRLKYNSVIRVLEGGKNNLPDESALTATRQIVNLVSACNHNDIVFVLISGGGSALLPHPISPVTLKEKVETISRLSLAGADITELNSVRTALSNVKGGKLAILAYPATTAALIISDIIEDPLHLIASGPTVLPNSNIPSVDAFGVLKKYNLMDCISSNVKETLRQYQKEKPDIKMIEENHRLHNFIIGNNMIALEAAVEESKQKKLFPILLSNRIDGRVSEVADIYTKVIEHVCRFLTSGSKSDFHNTMEHFQARSRQNQYVTDITQTLITNIDSFDNCRTKQKPMCFIAGGEPTVQVTGSGIGGRNQELALEMSIRLHSLREKHDCINTFDVTFMSAGTDGVDGPTDAAGAMAHGEQINEAFSSNLNARMFLENNDSYSFYRLLKNGYYLIKTGHTGTNVMDIHIISINFAE